MTRTFLVVLGVTAVVSGCGGDSGSEIPGDCNPLGGVQCLMPWPSSVYLDEDASTASGFRVAIPPGAMPVNIDGIAVDPSPFNRYDGFGPTGVILAGFPSGVDPIGLPRHTNLDESLAADSPIILLNMSTRERVSFFAEVDLNTDKPERRALIIRPMERMEPGTRHVVAIRKSVRAPDGAELEVPAAFQALVDGKGFDHPLFAKLEPRYPDIFAALESEGVARDDLVVAWDFVTASDEGLQSDLVAMRDQALPAIGTRGANLTFSLEQGSAPAERVYRLYNGTHTAPNFLSDGESDTSILLRDASGTPQRSGNYDANLSIIVPACVATAQLPIPAVIFGHGLFGTARDYLEDDLAQRIANEHCFVVIGGDWIGLTERQITSAAFTVNDLNRGVALVEKLHQAVINFIAMTQLTLGPLAASAEMTYEGTPVIDTSRVYYLGASLGGIMGGTFMAYDPVIERGALGVPGGAWSLMIERSFAWLPLQVAALAAYEDQYTYQMIVALLALGMERSDPATTAAHVIHDPLPGTPPKQLLLWEAIEDSLITNLATELMARTYRIPVVGPSLKVPWRMEEQVVSMSSGLAIYDEHASPPASTTNVPPIDDNGTHGGVNDRAAVLLQLQTFLNTGDVIATCQDGGTPVPCDCSTGACD